MSTLHPASTPQAFRSAEEAWFWCVRPVRSVIPRPCVPYELMRLIDGLYRQRLLTIDHLHVMRFYGARQRRPDWAVRAERRAHGVWVDAMRHLHDAFERRGIVQTRLRRALIDFSLERAMKDIAHA